MRFAYASSQIKWSIMWRRD